MLVEIKVQKLVADPITEMPLVILREADGDRVLPILIGPGEAHAIGTEMESIKFSRPLTHDLLVSVIGSLGGSPEKVVISRVEDDTYYAELIIRRDEELISVDARPSDSIAIALRTRTQIFVEEELLRMLDIAVAESKPVESTLPDGFGRDEKMDPEQLKEYLRQLDPEDFGRFTP